MMGLFRAEAPDSLNTLRELRDNPRVPAQARISCARDILDRALGKPVQRIESSNVPTSDDPAAEIERLEAEVFQSVDRAESARASPPGRASEQNKRLILSL